VDRQLQLLWAARVYKQLRREGYVVARCTVTRVMADIGLRGVQRGRKQFTKVPDDTAPRPADLVERQFVADRPNQLWLADITYVSTWQGWLYVAFILDVHSRMVLLPIPGSESTTVNFPRGMRPVHNQSTRSG